jgi:hypothetical protein
MSHPIEVSTPSFGITDHPFSIFVGMANKDPALPVLTKATEASAAIVTHYRQQDSGLVCRGQNRICLRFARKKIEYRNINYYKNIEHFFHCNLLFIKQLYPPSRGN